MPLKILLLSDSRSEHTEKWALGLASKGIHVGVFSFNKATYDWINNHPLITLLHEAEETVNAKKLKTKIKYIKNVGALKAAIATFKPDILHAHYATSYGLIGALSGFHPYIISVWGMDVYGFPNASYLHKSLLKYNLRKADMILSTSEIMKQETLKYTGKNITVTPFGVDTSVFKKANVSKEPNTIYIGTIKSIEEKYGIRYIIEAAKILKDRIKNQKLKFLLIGAGSQSDYYKKQIAAEGLADTVELTGRIKFSDVPHYHNLLDIFLNVSIDDSESFGVAVVEAMSSETPVIVSDVGGLMEVIDKGKFGIIVKKKNAVEIADAIEKLINNPQLREEMGKKGREHVLNTYDFNVSLNKMIEAYNSVLKK